MPVQIIKGDIFKSGAAVLVNPVNCVGVLGGGLAWQFKQRFADFGYVESYQRACDTGRLRIGRIHTYRLSIDHDPKWIISFPTKKHWRNPSQLSYIHEGLLDLRWWLEPYITLDPESVALPALGCGLGGLYWPKVQDLIIRHLWDLPNEVTVYLQE